MLRCYTIKVKSKIQIKKNSYFEFIVRFLFTHTIANTIIVKHRNPTDPKTEIIKVKFTELGFTANWSVKTMLDGEI